MAIDCIAHRTRAAVARRNADPSFQLFVKSLKGRTHTFEATTNTTILEFLIMVEQKDVSPMSQSRLIYAGKQLEMHRTLSSYAIYKESTLHLVLQLKGS